MKKFKALAVVLFLVVGVTGCNGIFGGGPTTVQETLTAEERSLLKADALIYAYKADLDLMLDDIIAYKAQPLCTEGIVVGCHQPRVVKYLVEAADAANKALDVARLMTGDDREAAALTARATLRELTIRLVQYSVLGGVQ